MTNILIVDDEEPVRRLIAQMLDMTAHNCILAANTSEASELLKKLDFELILCDINMPGTSGLAFIHHALTRYPGTAVVMVTAMDDSLTAKVALESGAYDYIIKPFDRNRLLISVASALHRRELEIDNRAHLENLEKDVAKRTASLQDSMDKWQKALEGSINAMALTVELRDPYTAGHQQRVADLACAIAAEMGIPEDRIDGLRMAATIHDIGKLCIPAEILSKPGNINEIEFNIIKTHAKAGYNILKSIEFPWPIADMVVQHHERIDGSGYPSGLSGAETLLEAQILSVADVVEAMASHRPYRPALGLDKALEEISKHSGVLYNPEVAEACLKVFKERGFGFNYKSHKHVLSHQRS
ncbi:MAG: hypothetical protein BA872_06205 [Desulfobacterales bacterium C00003060]|nr:MAG: hypothetical protein BA861_02420 [Desulfobacterales bacterium S3730MH5]OEU80235.1 MAG: hypothetical protein BA872_06205 [Desulfobacterales bacterium C00003060]OEU81565.1 MAG: hypothetical protein BA865_06310 [Desulfobacterales bacterium S5133MH4]